MENFLPPDPGSIFYEDSRKYYSDRPVSPELQQKLHEQRQQFLLQQQEELKRRQQALAGQQENVQAEPQPETKFLEPTPNSTASLVTGIFALLFSLSWCKWYGTVLGILTACIALYLSGNGIQMVKTSPDVFSASGLGNLRTGKILGIISLCICALSFIALIVYYSFVSSENF